MILNSEFRNKNLEVWNTDFRNLRNSNNFFTELHRDFTILIVLIRDTPRRFTLYCISATLRATFHIVTFNLNCTQRG